MSNLQDFLNKNLIKDMVIEVCVSDRFVDENGEPMLFKIRAMTGIILLKKMPEKREIFG